MSIGVQHRKERPPNEVCPDCGTDNHDGGKEVVEAEINGIPCEVSFICHECGATLNFWAYGSFRDE